MIYANDCLEITWSDDSKYRGYAKTRHYVLIRHKLFLFIRKTNSPNLLLFFPEIVRRENTFQ